VTAAGGTTTVHLPPSTNNLVNAVDAARLGVTFIEHHYGIRRVGAAAHHAVLPARLQLQRREPPLPRGRPRLGGGGLEPESRARLLNDVADSLVQYGVTMLPTRVVYEANRDILRAQSLPWHEKYTHQALCSGTPNPAWHGAFHWDWTHDDEETGATRSTSGAPHLRVQQARRPRRDGHRRQLHLGDRRLLQRPRAAARARERACTRWRCCKAATHNSAQTLREPNLGLVRPGYLADLVIVDGNPAENFRHLYSFGAIRMGEDGEMYRTRGIVHTIKDGVVIENANLMREVERMVAESKAGAQPLITERPFRRPIGQCSLELHAIPW
jgi:hypothetical protein